MPEISSMLPVSLPLTGLELMPVLQGGGAEGNRRMPALLNRNVPQGAVVCLFRPMAADLSGTAASDPGAGNVRWNNADPNDATELYISHEDAGEEDISSFLSDLQIGGFVYLQAVADSARRSTLQKWRVISISDDGDYSTVGVEPVAIAGDFLADEALELTLQQPAATSEGGAPWAVTFKPYDNEPPGSNYATLDLRNNRPVLDFDATTQEACVFTSVLPAGYGGNGIAVTLYCAASTATSGTIGWDVAFERVNVTGLDTDTDSFATAVAAAPATVPGTSGQILAVTVNLADGAEIDGLQAGELFRLRVRRDVSNDTATGDAELLAVHMREQ